MHLPDRVTGTLLVVLGAFAAYGGSRLPPVPGQQVGPSVFPVVVGLGLVLCGLLVALKVGRRFEEAAEADLAAIEGRPAMEPAARPARPLSGLRVLLPPALLLFYVLAADRLGFVVTGAVVILASALALGARPRFALPLALLAPFGVHLVFAGLLRVPLPVGLVPTPW